VCGYAVLTIAASVTNEAESTVDFESSLEVLRVLVESLLPPPLLQSALRLLGCTVGHEVSSSADEGVGVVAFRLTHHTK